MVVDKIGFTTIFYDREIPWKEANKGMSKKKVGIIIAVVVVIATAVAVGALFLLRGGSGSTGNGDKVYVESVASINGANIGVQNRYSGKIEPQKTWEVKKNPEKTVKELLVAEGDMVEVGTPLFEYDTDEIEGQIAQAKLELEGIDNEISGYYSQIESLKKERADAPEDAKFQYTTQIQTVETSIKQAEFNKKSKNVEIGKMEESINNSVVTSELAGVIKKISENGYDSYSGEELPYISVLAVGDFRVKGLVNEMNMGNISQGAPVLIRSRVNEEQTWTGVISEVGTQEEQNNNNGYYDGGGAETATKYPFYVTLDSTEGLMLGQHVYIELDFGQTVKKEGIWLYDTYIAYEEDGSSYVWADNGKGRIEKRAVEVGEFDGNLFMYQILSGLTEEDYVAYPMDSLYEGVETVTDPDQVDYSSPMYNQDMEGMDGMEGGFDEGMPGEDGMLPEEGMEGIAPEGMDDMMPENDMPADDTMMDGDGTENGMPEEGGSTAVPDGPRVEGIGEGENGEGDGGE